MKKSENNVKKKKSVAKKSPARKKQLNTIQTAEDCTKEEKGNTKIDLTEEGSTVNIDRALARAKQSTSTFKKPDEPLKKESALQQKKGQSKDAKKTSNMKSKAKIKSEPPAEDAKPRSKTSTINSQTSFNSNSSGTNVPVVDHTGNTVIEEQDGSGPADARCKKSIKDWALGLIKRGVDPILHEYKSLPSTEISADRYKTWSENAEFNRYHNTFCLDTTRVKVGSNEKTGYIHANYVGLEDHAKKFICAQGPMDCTVDRFWQMIVAEGAEFVVMLCDPIESKKEKCFKYWPSEVAEKLSFGGVTITNNGSLELETAKPIQVTVSLLNVKQGDKGYLLRHFHWKGWPDHGVPKSFLATTKLLSAIKATTKPVVVHCSAGVGRTGTLVLISLAQARLLKDGFPGIQETLIRFREQRAQAVQNEMQYLYVHRCLVEYYVEKRCLPKKAAEKFFKDYDTYFTAADQKRKKKKDTTKEMDAAS